MKPQVTYNLIETPPVVVVLDVPPRKFGFIKQMFIVAHIMAAPILMLVAVTFAALMGRQINYRNSVALTVYRNVCLLGHASGIFKSTEVHKDDLPGCSDPDCKNCNE